MSSSQGAPSPAQNGPSSTTARVASTPGGEGYPANITCSAEILEDLIALDGHFRQCSVTEQPRSTSGAVHPDAMDGHNKPEVSHQHRLPAGTVTQSNSHWTETATCVRGPPPGLPPPGLSARTYPIPPGFESRAPRVPKDDSYDETPRMPDINDRVGRPKQNPIETSEGTSTMATEQNSRSADNAVGGRSEAYRREPKLSYAEKNERREAWHLRFQQLREEEQERIDRYREEHPYGFEGDDEEFEEATDAANLRKQLAEKQAGIQRWMEN